MATTYMITREGAPEDELPRVVDARNDRAAIAYAARETFKATPISTAQAMAWAAKGVKHEDATVKKD